MVRLLPKEEVALRWGTIEPFISAALDTGLGEHSSYDLFIECQAAISQCWEHKDGWCITRVKEYPQYKQLQVVAVSGEGLFTCPENIYVVEEFARGIGCRNISITGRRGWKRVLKEYTEPYTTLIKEL